MERGREGERAVIHTLIYLSIYIYCIYACYSHFLYLYTYTYTYTYIYIYIYLFMYIVVYVYVRFDLIPRS